MDNYTLRKRLEQRRGRRQHERFFMSGMMIFAYRAGDVKIFYRHVDLN